jgi:hypothetical protein
VTDGAAALAGAGLLHALSGTCAIDIDNTTLANDWLAARGVNLDELLNAPDAVRISSGRPGRAKLIYRLKRPLATVKPDGSGIELRCATVSGSSVQDVLPPTVHPDTGKPYVWQYGEPLIGDWRMAPPIPASLLALWRDLAPAINASAGKAESQKPQAQKPQPKPSPTPPSDTDALLAKLRKGLEAKDPDSPYDAWIKIGMGLHDATGGAQEGFDLWDAWSAKATRARPDGKPVYGGTDSLLVHWRSFASVPGKRVVTSAILETDTPAAPDEFPLIASNTPPDPDSELDKMLAAATVRTQEAIAWLEKRLVFVRNSGLYFDTQYHRLIESDRALVHEFMPGMPARKRGRLDPLVVLKESKTKRVVEAVAFHPGRPVTFQDSRGDWYANYYRDRLPEPLEPQKGELDRIDWLFSLIWDGEYRTWLKEFFAHAVQHPGVKIKSAPLIWSRTEGNGKTTLLRVLPVLLFGRDYSREVTTALLNSDFNDYLLKAWHVNLSEFRADSRGERRTISDKLKAWITEDEIALHPKGSAAYNIPNHFIVTATSNEADAAFISEKDRRWSVHQFMAKPMTEKEQRWLFDDFLRTPRAAAVLRHYFLNYKITTFKPDARALENAAKRDMVTASRSADVEILHRTFAERSPPFDRDVVRVGDVASYLRHTLRVTVTEDKVGRILSEAPFEGARRVLHINGGMHRVTIIRHHKKWLDAPSLDIFAEATKPSVDILA